MRLLLTSGGIRNDSIRRALDELLPAPVEQCTALCIPTAQWGHPMCGPVSARGVVAGVSPYGSLTSLPWKSLGLLEVSALESVGQDRWEPWVREADVLLVDGGDATYLAHHLRASGLAALLPRLEDTVWVGLSAGSMVLAPRIGSDFVAWSGAPDDRTLGLVEFAMFPHLDVFPSNTLDAAHRWLREVGPPAYVLDDESAIVVDAGAVRVVSEGTWHRFDA